MMIKYINLNKKFLVSLKRIENFRDKSKNQNKTIKNKRNFMTMLQKKDLIKQNNLKKKMLN